jgi:hypothetical protein
MVHQAINTDPARFARVHYTAMPADAHRTEGAHHAYLQCLALAVGGQYPMGDSTPDDGAAWRAMHDELCEVIRQAADTLDEPDYDAAVSAVRAVASTYVPTPTHHAARPTSMQERILAALTDVGQRAGCQVNLQPDYVNTGRMYITTAITFSVLVELSYMFGPDTCQLYFRGPLIEALGLHDSPPRFRYQNTSSGGQLDYHALRYAEGDRIDAMLDLLTRALAMRPKHF